MSIELQRSINGTVSYEVRQKMSGDSFDQIENTDLRSDRSDMFVDGEFQRNPAPVGAE